MCEEDVEHLSNFTFFGKDFVQSMQVSAWERSQGVPAPKHTFCPPSVDIQFRQACSFPSSTTQK